MSNRRDIRLDETNDFVVVDGDFDIEYSDQQHIKDILESGQGNWKQNPGIGVYIEEMLNGPFGLSEKRYVRENLSSDGYAQVQLFYDVSTGKIKIRI